MTPQNIEDAQKEIDYAYKAGQADENKEWREGRRCDICGEPKSSNLTSTCDSCLKNG